MSLAKTEGSCLHSEAALETAEAFLLAIYVSDWKTSAAMKQ